MDHTTIHDRILILAQKSFYSPLCIPFSVLVPTNKSVCFWFSLFDSSSHKYTIWSIIHDELILAK